MPIKKDHGCALMLINKIGSIKHNTFPEGTGKLESN